MLKNDRQEITDFLKAQGEKGADALGLFETALAFSALRHKNRSLDRYYYQMDKLAASAQEQLAEEGSDHNDARLAALKTVFVKQHHYTGNSEHYDLIDNADLCFVFDHGKGLPVALSVLYLEVCERLDWPAEGVNFPSHFLLRLVGGGGPHIVFDPFHDAHILNAPELREMVKRAKGPQAELDQAYFQAANKRDILLRLQNNIKNRQIAAEDYFGALDTVLTTEYIAPREYRLLLDKGVLLAKCQKSEEAIEVLEQYMDLTPYAEDRADARMFIEQIHRDLL